MFSRSDSTWKYTAACLLVASSLAGTLMAQGPRISSPTAPSNPYGKTVYPWKTHITATIFWIGESSTANNPTPNYASSWDVRWQQSYGGFDNPDPSSRTHDYRPIAFIPRQNPFYVALPYNDLINHQAHKPEASRVIPWFRKYQPKPGESVCKGRWIQIVYKNRSCFAQWEDCGPFTTEDWRYVFGNARPVNQNNQGAGIDLSPAIRDYFRMKSGEKVHWRFVDFADVPQGPWSRYGANNPFVNAAADRDLMARQRYLQYLRDYRDQQQRKRSNGEPAL